VLAAGAAAVAVRRVDAQLHDRPEAVRAVARAVGVTALGTGRALALLGPLPWLTRSPRVAALLLAPPLLEWWQRRPAADPVTFTAAALAGQAAYGAGVVAGCVRERTALPLLPRLP
ncbi:MAG: hypothetical protein ACXVGH_10735, partial [Mycobacteriales bacterium]